jgi:hypothetical protein
MLVEGFDLIGLGQWLCYVAAAVEIIGAVALLSARFAVYGAVWLAITMFFATLAHVFAMHNNSAPALVLLILNLVVYWLRRDQFNPRKYFRTTQKVY